MMPHISSWQINLCGFYMGGSKSIVILLGLKGGEQAHQLNRKPKTLKEEGYNETISDVLNLRVDRSNFSGFADPRSRPGRQF